ncbi:hypothetical protein [Bacteroides sp.]|nr:MULTISPECIES: hypothetical protein [Bacteroides]
MKKMSSRSTIIINAAFYLLSISLLGMVAYGLSHGLSFFTEYYWLFITLFFAWWMVLFLKLKKDNKRRKEMTKNFGHKIRERNSKQ